MATDSTPATETFSIGEARAIVRDLFDPNPWIYWTDFLLSMAVGVTGFTLYQQSPRWEWAALGYIMAVVAFYRTALFTHELVHLRDNSFKLFRVTWNVLCGIPFLMPTFTYYTHLLHHSRKHYGTPDDGEYLPLGASPIVETFKYLLQIPVIPLVAVFRFLVLAPLSWLCPPLRRWLYIHASSMVMDPSYLRPLPTNDELRIWRFQELGVFLICASTAALVWHGDLPVMYVLKIYGLSLGIMTINHLRTLGAHRFINRGGEMTFVEQLTDSLNYPSSGVIGGIWAPVGLRFHALHHLFPSMPYHNLERAHHRLMQQLPADSPYRLTVRSGLWVALRELWQNALHSQQSDPHTTASDTAR